MVVATRHDDPQEWAEALGATSQALAKDSRMAEATFNRALIFEALSLAPAARRTFEHYLDLDPNSPWSAEARRHLAALQPDRRTWQSTLPRLRTAAARGAAEEVTELVRVFPQQARTWSEAEFLGAWGERTVAGRTSEAAEELTIARSIGNALRAVNGECLVGDAVGVIDSAPSEAARLDLAKAHAAYRDGRRQQASDRAAALALLEASRETFKRAGSPMAPLADYYAANVLYDGLRYAEARERLTQVRAAARPAHRALLAQSLWLEGLIDVLDGRVDACVENFDRAKNAFAALGENDNAFEMASRAAGMVALLGKRDEAWHRWPEVFAAASRSDDPGRVQGALSQTALSELRQGNYAIAKALLDDIAGTDAALNARLRFNVYLWRALTAAKMGLPTQSDDDLTRARGTIPHIDSKLRDRVWSELRRAEAIMVRDRDPVRAAQLLRAPIDANAANSLWRVAELVERARAERATGNVAEATADLRQATALAESQRQRVARDDIRDAFFGNASDAFIELTELLDRAGDAPSAFDVAERGRSRLILDRLRVQRGAAQLSPSAILAAIPPSTTVLHFTATGDDLITFVISRDSISSRIVRISRTELEQLARQLSALAEDGRIAAVTAISESLSARLIGGLESHLASSETLVFVPDESTAGIVWSLLRDPSTHRFLVEDHRLVLAPSAAAFVARTTPQPRRSIVAVGDPRVGYASDELPALPSAAQEAAAVAALYPQHKLLTGAAAFPDAVRSAIDDADVLHLATHAVLRPSDPSMSFIALSGSDGRWYLPEIAAQPFKRVRLVVAAGCRTGTRSAGKGDLRSLASAFLTAGAHSVVATAWDVEDGVTARFSELFHRALRSGREPASALREAQLAMMHSADPRLRAPSAWAAFQVYGSGN